MPDHVREAAGEALALAVAENVIRADLNPSRRRARSAASSTSRATRRRRLADAEPQLADLTAVWLAERPQDAALFPADPGAFARRRAPR
jgi:hypothetical protein